MKTFSAVYKRSKEVVSKEREAAVAKDHAMLVESIKKQYGINDFSRLSESEKASYKALINEMWDSRKGINAKGVSFINEGNAPLTPKSTDEQIKKFVQREVKANVEKYIMAIANREDCSLAAGIREAVKSQTGRFPKEAKQWAFEVIAKAVSDGMKKIKF